MQDDNYLLSTVAKLELVILGTPKEIRLCNRSITERVTIHRQCIRLSKHVCTHDCIDHKVYKVVNSAESINTSYAVTGYPRLH